MVLTLRYLCDPRKRRSTANDLWEKILEEFGKHERIDFAYRTHRQYLHPYEGKVKLGGGQRPLPPRAGAPERAQEAQVVVSEKKV